MLVHFLVGARCWRTPQRGGHFTGCIFTLTCAVYLHCPEHFCFMQSLSDILQCLKSTYGSGRTEDAQRSFMASVMHRLAADEEVHSCCSNPPVITSSYYNQSDMCYYTRLEFNHHPVTTFVWFCYFCLSGNLAHF